MEYVVKSFIPNNWSSRPISLADYKLVGLYEWDPIYISLERKVQGRFNLGVSKIERVENLYLWTQYSLRKEEYETKGLAAEHELFHDTSTRNVRSIVETNLDWRRANRVRYGHGVSFTPSPEYANRQSCRSNGTDRALILCKVLVQNKQIVNSYVQLPLKECDTTVGNGGSVYVKFYDDEFYPLYIIYYRSW